MVCIVVMHVNYISMHAVHNNIACYMCIMYQSLSISCGKRNLSFILWVHKTEKG